MKNLVEIMERRYSTKKFDTEKKISEENMQQLKDILRLSASSVNAQPWHFVIAQTEEGKKEIAKSTQGFFGFNEEKVLTASHIVVLCSRTDMTDEYLTHILEKEEADGRFLEEEFKIGMDMGRRTFVNIHKYDLKDLQHWLEKQVYLNMGNLLLGAAALGIDAVPMEGFDMKVLDETLGLRQKGFTAIGVVPLGYRAKDDFNATLPKSRLAEKEVISII